jgi:hypothetical protein
LLGTGTKIKLHIAPSYLDLKKYLYYYNIWNVEYISIIYYFQEPEWAYDWKFVCTRKYIIDILGSIYDPFLEITPRAPAFTPFL